MPDVAVRSRPFQRSELARALAGDPRLIAAFEALGIDVSKTLPEAAGTALEAAAEALDVALEAGLGAGVGRHAASEAQALARAALELAALAEGAISTVAALREEVAALRNEIEGLKQGAP